MTQPIHRHASGTKAARQIMAQIGRIFQSLKDWAGKPLRDARRDMERAAWNARVDARRAAKKLEKESKHAA